ncbi:DUF2971 domain-containing protein [Methylomonas methanica]|uniref:DUF2971 family protein n=1 Tax=Methylomonas methanica (strain DSM 25384 / MC09) TaxID=857087 RepID=F9ZYE6_METMM|nr:DUF2971 domain-containing protein [Methylomonas methanica]AEG01051.1 hypothetical protein Metme_2665 [Methylomonas methanica MC09]
MTIERLYKFGKLNEFSEALFSTASVYFSSAAEFNDPFECTPSFEFTHEPDKIMDQLVRAVLANNPRLTHHSASAEALAIYLEDRHRNSAVWEALKNDLIHEFRHCVGIYCLTERRDSILMWSHYADDHKGFCIEFEATDYTPVFGGAQQVSYEKEYPEINFYNTPIEDKVKLSLLTKFTDWNYEREWRILDHDIGSGTRTYPAELMKSVTFGIRMLTEHKEKIRDWVSARGCDVQFYQAVQGKDRFEVAFLEA